LIPRDQYQPVEKAAQQGALRAEVSPQYGTLYGLSRQVLHSPLGLPSNPPPWGELVAVDVSRGSILWKAPLGTTADMIKNPAGKNPAALVQGTPNLGGPIMTVP
jgi:quinoprotein glucose dehydrogenase